MSHHNDGHPCASTTYAPRGASAPDPSGQVDRASAGIDADVGVLNGWKLVPVEPTEAMIKVGDAQLDSGAYAERIYRAMLAAAPTPSSPKGGDEPDTAPLGPDDTHAVAPEDQCDSASGAQGELMQDLHEFDADALCRLNMQLEGRIAELEAANQCLREHVALIHNKARHEFAEAVDQAIGKAFTAMSGIEALRECGSLLSGGSDGR